MVVKNNTMFSITSVCKADIIGMYIEGVNTRDKIEEMKQVEERLKKMSKADMKYLASKLADDYCEQLYWISLKNIFEDKFLNESEVN